MTRAERIEALLTAHSEALGQMAAARTDRRNAHRHIEDARRAIEAWASAHDAAAEIQDVATAAVMKANRAAIALLHDDDTPS
jgi:hypothetical protein